MDTNDFLVLLQAKLNEEASKGNINADLKTIAQAIEKLKVQAEIDPNSVKNIAEQLSKILNQKIVVDNIQIDAGQAVKSMQQAEQQIVNASNAATAAVVQNEERKRQAYQETADAQKKLTPQESIIKDKKYIPSFAEGNDAAKLLQKEYEKLLNTEKEVIATTERFNGGNLSSFTINIKRANGEVESLNYSLRETEQNGEKISKFQFTGGKINDAEAIKQIKAVENAFANFTQKIEQFKSNYNSKLSGLTKPLSEFESALSGLKSGASTIDEVRNSFKLLQSEASKIDAPLKRQLSTFDSYKNAVDKGKESIDGYRAQLKGLSNAPKELSQELTKAAKLLLQINKTQATEGTTANWSKQAREFVDLLDNIGNKINVIKKEQANSATSQIFNVKDLDAQGKIYIQKVSNTIEKTKSELESKLRNAGYMDIQIKGVEDASGKIKSLTANVTDATGAFKQLNFERAKIQNQGKAQAGFIQTDNVKVTGNISSFVETVQNNLASLKAKWEEQGILVGEFKTKVEGLEASLANVGSKGELNGLQTQIKALSGEAARITQANKIQLSIDTGGYESKVETLISRTRQWTDEFGNAKINTYSLRTALKGLNDASTALSNNNTVANQKALIDAEKELKVQLDTVSNSIKKMNAEFMKSSAVDALKQKYQEFYDLNGKSHRKFGADMKRAMAELASGADVSIQRYRELDQQLITTQNTCRQMGLLGKTFFQTIREGMKSFSYWTSSTFLVMRTIRAIKNDIATVKALDDALVDLKKTTTMSAAELEKFYYEANEVAKRMGVTTKEIISQAAAWSRFNKIDPLYGDI